ncbi:MAG: hypothetical protein OHK0026_06510 [Rhodocyclaceae bacterium]
MLDTLGRLATSRFFENPVFLVGGSRSGTVAMLKAIGMHPEILSSPGEDPFVTDVGGMMYDLEYASETEKQYYLRSLRIPMDYIHRHLKRLCFESAFGPHFGLKSMVKSVLHREANPLAKRHWCTKTFPSEKVAKGLMRLYPRAKFIWILRNGVNVVHSRTKFPEFRDLDFSEHCRSWADLIVRFGYLLELREAVVVRQEDFADDPDGVFRRIFDLIGVPYHEASTNFSRTTLVHPLADESTTRGVDVRKTLKERPPVHAEWSSEQRETFTRICAHAMQLAGYEMPF